MNNLVPLRQTDASCGTKAFTLGHLLRAGITVPDGFVVRQVHAHGWASELFEALRRLGGARFAVRSSAVVEDTAQASFAGQYLTLLDVPFEEVAQAVRRVAASGLAAVGYAAATGRPALGPVAVLVQPMLSPVAAGVAFTRDPVTGAEDTVIEAVRGVGELLVAGSVPPQRWRPDPTARLIACGVPDVLSPAQAHMVRDHAHRVETLLGGGQNVEWALGPGTVLWVLQARPITTPATTMSRSAQADTGHFLATGTAASPGTARGRMRVLFGRDDFADFQAGDVLVCRATSPAWTPVLARAAAVITEIGGILAHAAIVARELRIPAVTDVPHATTLPEGHWVTVDGTQGTITLTEDQ